MRSHFIVLDAPFFNLFTSVVQIEEPMPAEAFEPYSGIEAFHIGVVRRLAWPGEVERHAVGIGPTDRAPST